MIGAEGAKGSRMCLAFHSPPPAFSAVPALTFDDAPLGLPAQDTPPIHQVLSVSPDHSKGDPVLQEDMKQKGWPCLGGGERSR